MAIHIPYHIQTLEPYQAGKSINDLAKEKNLTRIVKLASNENPFGTSPKVQKVLNEHASQISRYPDPNAKELIHALSQKYPKKESQMICGHGSDSLLLDALMAFSEEGDEILTSQGTFVGFCIHAKKLNRELIQVPLQDYRYDLERIKEAITPLTKIIYLANPNNPTGSIFAKHEFETFLMEIPSGILVILDEAYALYAMDNPQYPNGIHYDLDNLLVIRTLSKSHGLAGLRIGFAAGSEELINEMYKVRLPFEPNILAQKAAIAALDDEAFLQKVRKTNRVTLDMIASKVIDLGIQFVNSSANFILMLFPSENFARDFTEACLNRGLILRQTKAFGIANGVRINSGTLDETEFALGVLEESHAIAMKKAVRVSGTEKRTIAALS